MVATIRDPETRQVALVITPYAPLSWQGSVLILLVLSTLIMSGAVLSGMLGNWYAMLPSASLCIAIALAFRSGYRRTQRREVVKLVDDAVSVERGHVWPESRCTLPRAGAEVLLGGAAADAHEHLYLCSNEQKVEIGEFLEDEERRELADSLRQLLRSAGRLSPVAAA
jgi:uncharacterized membrane protein